MKANQNTVLLALAAGLITTSAQADFTEIDVLGGFNGVALNLAVSDFMGNNSNDTTFVFGTGLEDYPLSVSNQIQTAFGVTGTGSALVTVAHDSPSHISTTGTFMGSANTFGVQGAAQGGAGGGIFFGFTLDADAQIQMDWSLSDSLNNNADDLGLLRLYSMSTMGPLLLEINQDGNGLDMMGSQMLNLSAGHYVLLATSEVTVNANEFDPLIEGTSGFDVGFTIVPAPASMMLLGTGFLVMRRRR